MSNVYSLKEINDFNDILITNIIISEYLLLSNNNILITFRDYKFLEVFNLQKSHIIFKRKKLVHYY